jgi:alpha-1,2-mannosyltransferase
MRNAWMGSLRSQTTSRRGSHKTMLPSRPRVHWVVISALFLLVGLRAVSQAAFFSSEATDFTVYFSAADALTRGQDPYSIVSARGWHFISPVATAVLFTPLTQFPTAIASAIWYLLSIGFLGATIVLALDLLVPNKDSDVRTRTWIIALLVLAGPMIVTLSRGQWSLLIGFLITLGWWLYEKDRLFFSGFCFGFAAALKVLPIVFAFYLIVKRRWIALGGFITALVIGAVVMPGIFVKWSEIPRLHEEWFRLVLYPALTNTHNTVYGELLNPALKRNQSFAAVVFRTANPSIWIRTACTLLLDASVAVIAAMTLWHNRIGRNTAVDAAEVGVVTCLMLFVSPVTWSHYYAELLLPTLLLTCVATGLVMGPLPQKRAITLLSVMFMVAVIHEFSAAAQMHGALLLNGAIVFGSCCYWAWRTDARERLTAPPHVRRYRLFLRQLVDRPAPRS